MLSVDFSKLFFLPLGGSKLFLARLPEIKAIDVIDTNSDLWYCKAVFVK